MPRQVTNNASTLSDRAGRRGYLLPSFCAVAWVVAVGSMIWDQPASISAGVSQITVSATATAPTVDNSEETGSVFIQDAGSQLNYVWVIPRSWYDPMIERVANDHGVDPALVKAVVQAESAFDPLAVSVDGARGLMQVLPETAARFRVRDLNNPYLNLQAGVGYLRDLLDQFEGDVRLAVAAYNAGENAVRRHQGVPPYPETQRYLNKVMGLYRAYRQPA